MPRTAFEPEPAVESAIVVVEPFSRGEGEPGVALDAAQQDALWRLVQAAFRERRKMLHNVLARQLPMDAVRVRSALDAAGIDPERRGRRRSPVEEWIGLMDGLGPLRASIAEGV